MAENSSKTRISKDNIEKNTDKLNRSMIKQGSMIKQPRYSYQSSGLPVTPSEKKLTLNKKL